MNHKSFCLVFFAIFFTGCCAILRKEQHPLLFSKAGKENLHKINLKKTMRGPEHIRQAIQFISTHQSENSNRDKSSMNNKVFAQKQDFSDSNHSMHKLKLFNYKNVQYTGEIAIGNQGNTFNVIYDTGSANIWINSKHCKNQGCISHKQYDSQKSPTFVKGGDDLDVEFGTGELVGQFGKDTMFFSDIMIENQEFVEVYQEIGGVFQEAHFDGIVGLAFPAMAAYNKNPLFDNLMLQKRITNNVFAFYMSPLNGMSDSEISIGGPDQSKYTGQINYHKVLKGYYWLIGADNILVGGKDIGLCKHKCYVVADTGTSLITGPSNSINALLSQVHVNSNCSNVSELPSITFILDGIEYTLNAEEYVLRDDGKTQTTVEASKSTIKKDSFLEAYASCVSSFMAMDIPNDEIGFQYEKAWILGDTFLQKYYSVYDRDNERVGFALSKQ